MITDIKIDGIYIAVETIYQCSKIRTKTKTLIINNKFLLNQRTPIRYTCDKCGTIHEVNFRLRDKFFNDRVYCKKCNRENTFIEKYGSKSFFSSEEGKSKIKEVKKQRYGDEYYTNREKAKQTNLERHGDKYYTNRKKAKKKPT